MHAVAVALFGERIGSLLLGEIIVIAVAVVPDKAIHNNSSVIQKKSS